MDRARHSNHARLPISPHRPRTRMLRPPALSPIRRTPVATAATARVIVIAVIIPIPVRRTGRVPPLLAHVSRRPVIVSTATTRIAVCMHAPATLLRTRPLMLTATT